MIKLDEKTFFQSILFSALRYVQTETHAFVVVKRYGTIDKGEVIVGLPKTRRKIFPKMWNQSTILFLINRVHLKQFKNLQSKL